MKYVAGAALLSLALAADPASAGTMLVGVPNPDVGDGSTRTVRLTVSNLGDVARRASPTFVPAGADGTSSGRVPLGAIAVGPKATVVVDNLASGGGLLEVVTAPQLVVRAELVLRSAAGETLSHTPLPITDGGAVQGAGTAFEIMSLVRGGGRITDLVVVNIDPAGEALCTAELFSSTGSPLGVRSRTVPPYSSVTIEDLLAGSSASEVRARVSCDQAWDAWALVTDLGVLAHRIEGRPALGTSTLTIPGADGCVPGGVCLRVPGEVHTATPSAPNRTIELQVPAGRSFSRMRLQFDLLAGAWYGPRSENQHNVFWLHRGPLGIYDRNVLGAVNARGTRNRLLLVTNLDMAPGDHTFDTANAALIPGSRYRVLYELESATRRATFTISRDGNVVSSITTVLGGPLGTGSTANLQLHFGHALNPGGVEVPWFGTTWSDLSFEAIP